MVVVCLVRSCTLSLAAVDRYCWKFLWPLILSMFHPSKTSLSFIFFGLLIDDAVCYGGQCLLLVFAYELFLGFFM